MFCFVTNQKTELKPPIPNKILYSPTESDALAPLLNLMALMCRVGLPTI